MKRLGSAMGSVNTILRLVRICVAGFVLALWFVPCVVGAQGVKSTQHRAGLSGGLGLLYVGIDDGGGTEDMGGAASIGVSYGYVATEDFEIGGARRNRHASRPFLIKRPSTGSGRIHSSR